MNKGNMLQGCVTSEVVPLNQRFTSTHLPLQLLLFGLCECLRVSPAASAESSQPVGTHCICSCSHALNWAQFGAADTKLLHFTLTMCLRLQRDACYCTAETVNQHLILLRRFTDPGTDYRLTSITCSGPHHIVS